MATSPQLFVAPQAAGFSSASWRARPQTPLRSQSLQSILADGRLRISTMSSWFGLTDIIDF